MSQYYDLGGKTLWNPSNGASRLFLRQVAVFEEELGVPSGIGPMEADECQVDAAALEIFVNALLTRHRSTHHAVMRTLTEGFVITMSVLAERAGVEVCWEAPRTVLGDGIRDAERVRASRLREKADELAAFMAR
ncbi:DUF6086 family protein [Kitasatospora sp. NPDC056531]|uniref:DUF6086 family protein n=1 Tax=Kitasatospora sp. NPDC056531 TaxID=3345856 RepID=UPI00367AE2D2